jgi:photoactive yellow protein
MEERRCLWCDGALTDAGAASGETLCADCNHSPAGVPELTSEQLDYLPFGIVELNRAGTVIAFNRAEESLSRRSRIEVIGRNFFTEVAPCADVRSFRGRFEDFLDGAALAERFDYTYHFADADVDVRLVFLRVNREVALVLSRRTPQRTSD